MSFWNLAKLEPTRKFRFQISSPGGGSEKGNWIHAKSVDKPTYDMNVGEYQIGNQKLKYPGIVTWGDVVITVVDIGKKAEALYNNLTTMGWGPPGGGNKGTVKEENAGKTPCRIIINQLNAKGTSIERWTLNNAFFKSINFGQLAYAEDELVEIQITVTYDYATFFRKKNPKELAAEKAEGSDPGGEGPSPDE